MNFKRVIAEYIQKYLREVEGREATIEEIQSAPYWEQVWAYWVASEHYGEYRITMSRDECRVIYGD